MSLSLQTKRLLRFSYITSRGYCENKSIYQKHEEGKKPLTIHGKQYPEWRQPWIQRDGEWKSKLSVFVEKSPSMNILYAMSQIPYLNTKKIKKWWKDMKEIQEIQNQQYLPERVTLLGPNLAAVHFFTFRGASVKLKDSNTWIFGDILSLNLPSTFTDGYIVEAIDCTNFHHNGIRYDGLKLLLGLGYLKWLSLCNNKHIDIWCLDRIAGQNGQTLEYLDITGYKLNVNSVIALSRMSCLKYLVISDPVNDIEVQSALSILEEEKPGMIIKIVKNEIS